MTSWKDSSNYVFKEKGGGGYESTCVTKTSKLLKIEKKVVAFNKIIRFTILKTVVTVWNRSLVWGLCDHKLILQMYEPLASTELEKYLYPPKVTLPTHEYFPCVLVVSFTSFPSFFSKILPPRRHDNIPRPLGMTLHVRVVELPLIFLVAFTFGIFFSDRKNFSNDC